MTDGDRERPQTPPPPRPQNSWPGAVSPTCGWVWYSWPGSETMRRWVRVHQPIRPVSGAQVCTASGLSSPFLTHSHPPPSPFLAPNSLFSKRAPPKLLQANELRPKGLFPLFFLLNGIFSRTWRLFLTFSSIQPQVPLSASATFWGNAI